MAEEPKPVLLALGWLVTVLGALWTLLAGGCTLAFLVSGSDPSSLPVVLMFGAAGIVPGALILWGGISIVRSQRKRG